MDSEKAADVRDAINGLPCVAYDPDPSHNYGEGKTRVTMHGPESVHTGPCVKLRDYTFCPAEINQAGEIGFGDGPLRPCYEVLVKPLAPPTRPLPSVSIPPALIHEVAKYDCRMRVSAGYRGEQKPGSIRVRDDLAHAQDPEADGDRCPDCRGTRFTLNDGVPECVRCGTRLEEQEPTPNPSLEEYL